MHANGRMTMALRYCFEQDKIKRTLDKSKRNDLAAIDTEEYVLIQHKSVKEE